MRNLGGAVGIAVSGAVLNNRMNFHFLNLASRLTTARAPMNQIMAGLQARFTGTPNPHQAALRALWNMANTQAATLSFADAFRFIAFAFAVALCLAPWLRQVTPPKPK